MNIYIWMNERKKKKLPLPCNWFSSGSESSESCAGPSFTMLYKIVLYPSPGLAPWIWMHLFLLSVWMNSSWSFDQFLRLPQLFLPQEQLFHFSCFTNWRWSFFLWHFLQWWNCHRDLWALLGTLPFFCVMSVLITLCHCDLYFFSACGITLS